MNTRTSEADRRSRTFQREGPNWIPIAGGALLSTFSVCFGYKLKQALDTKQKHNSSQIPNLNGESNDWKKSGSCRLLASSFSLLQDENGCYDHYTVSRNVVESKQQCAGQVGIEPEMTLPLMTVPSHEFNKENGVMWSASPDRIEMPQKFFHQFNSSEFCVSESGSDSFRKREVIKKLRQQLKRRDDMILEMQDKIIELQKSLSSQFSHYSHLQSLLDSANSHLFGSEREIHRLRKVIADNCVGHMNGHLEVEGI